MQRLVEGLDGILNRLQLLLCRRGGVQGTAAAVQVVNGARDLLLGRRIGHQYRRLPPDRRCCLGAGQRGAPPSATPCPPADWR